MTTWIERYRRQAEERYKRLDVVPLLADLPGREPKEKARSERSPSHRRRQGAGGADHPGVRRPRWRRCSARTSSPSCSRSGTARGLLGPVRRLDCRTGGAYRIAMSGPKGNSGERARLVPRCHHQRVDRADLRPRRRRRLRDSWRSIASRTWATAAPGSPRSRSSRASSTATRSSTPAWSTATPDSTSCSRSCSASSSPNTAVQSAAHARRPPEVGHPALPRSRHTGEDAPRSRSVQATRARPARLRR